MGWFLHSRLVTHVCVLVLVLLAGLATYYYAWSFSRKWENPTTTTGVIKGFAMTFHALFGLFSLLTSYSIRISSQSIMFGTWTTCGFASIVFDSWWFGLMVSRKGFDLLGSSRKGISVAFCVYSGFYAVYRLVVMLYVFHFDVRYNESLATTMGTVPAAAQGTAATVAPSVVHIAGPPVAHPPTTYQYPLSQHTVTQLRSLAKRLSIRRDSRRPFARLDQHDQEARDIDGSPDRRDGIEPPSVTGSRLSRIMPRKWWRPSHRGGQAGTEPPRSGRVPLIRVSEHQEQESPALDGHCAAADDDPILFDAASVGGSSLDSYDLVGFDVGRFREEEEEEISARHRREWSGASGETSDGGEFSFEEEDDEQEAQRAYEERRRRRRQAKSAA